MSAYQPSEEKLTEYLDRLVSWQKFGIFLPGINSENIQVIERDHVGNTDRQKAALLTKWLHVHPDASWLDVISALENSHEHALASKIYQKVNTSSGTSSAQPNTSHTFASCKVIKTLELESKDKEKTLLSSLEDLSRNFSALMFDIQTAFGRILQTQQYQLTDLITWIEFRLYWVQDLSDICDLRSFFRKLHQYFDFLDCGLIVDMCEKFINNVEDESLVCKLKKHMSDATALRQSSTVGQLKNALQSIYFPHLADLSGMPKIYIKLYNEWNETNTEGLYLLIRHLLPHKSKHLILEHIEIDTGSVVIKYIVNDSKVHCLIAYAQDKLQFMRLIGIFSLAINDKAILEEDENLNFSFGSALLEASRLGHEEAVQFLLELGSDHVDYCNEEGRTGLMLACKNGHKQVVQTLVSAGASINIQDRNGYTALMIACDENSYDIVNYLLQSMANPNLQRTDDDTALIIACRNGHSELVKLLLQFNTDVSITTENGEQALTISKHGNFQEIVEMLRNVDKNAEPTQQGIIPIIVVEDMSAHDQSHEKEMLLKDDVITPTNDVLATLQEPPIKDLTKQLDQTKLTVTRKFSGSRLKRLTKSMSDGDVDLHEEPFKPSTPPHSSRGSLSESGHEVGELPYNQKKHPFYQHSDADSAIGMSFEEDCSSMIFSEVQQHRSSSLLPIDYICQSRDAISIKLPQDAAIEVGSSLEWESNIVVIEDYPPNQEFKIFHKGDRIIQVGERLVRNMSVHEFSELFHSEASNGMTLKIIPNMEKSTQPFIEPTSIAMLRRTPSEQNLYDNIKTNINQLLSMRPPNSERTVTIPRSPNGFGFKMIGGKTMGVFISDICADVTQVYSGDQILNINGHNTQGLTLYDANQLLQNVSSDLQLTVVENRAKFLSVREQVESDSLYLRSLIDHTPTSNREMTLKKGSLLRVVNTFVHAPNYWLAWAVDERTGLDTQLKRIPSPVYAQRQFGHEVYERVQRSDVMYRRPVCIVGPQSDIITENLSKQDGFSLCKNIEQILDVCAKGSCHAVYSVSDKATLHLLTALQPIVLQIPTDTASLMEQVKFTKITVDGYLSGNKESDLVSQAIDQVHQLRSLPVWRPMGIIH